jgi:hypothetical protein
MALRTFEVRLESRTEAVTIKVLATGKRDAARKALWRFPSGYGTPEVKWVEAR